MAVLEVIGVRHHSPACARLVEHVIDKRRPRFVLIEGPSDMNGRLDEMLLGHRLPIAVYTYRLNDQLARARGTWSPFCDYSPEWVALRLGRESGADVHFIDLPAWHEAFEGVENRYSDLHAAVGCKELEVARQLGFDSTDSLWDHLFEQSKHPVALQRELADYFASLRENEAAGEQDSLREAWMAQWVAWAMDRATSDESVVVVCGGYHKPALEKLWPQMLSCMPNLPIPSDRIGSYLVPFSFHQLDSFTGYAAGMPSPAYYQESWMQGDGCAETMLFQAIGHLRRKGQPVSTADAVAASQLAQGLAQMRGHAVPLRTDILDGLAGALIKDALVCPTPWSTRGPLPYGTDPILVEIVAALSGDARGKLASDTPRPPLSHDVEQTMQCLGLSWSPEGTTISIDPLDAGVTDVRQFLYRLSILAIPGVRLVRPAEQRRGSAPLAELWHLCLLDETEPTIIERAVYGATLGQAAAAKIVESMQCAPSANALAHALQQALVAGLQVMALSFADRAQGAVDREGLFANLGEAIEKFLEIAQAPFEWRDETLMPLLAGLIGAACERALWLLEAIQGADVALCRRDVRAITAIRSCLREPHLLPTATANLAYQTFARRVDAASAPPALRGAALGVLWSMQAALSLSNTARAIAVTTSLPTAALGDYLSGLLALARDEFVASPLVEIIDARLRSLGQEEFLVVLPSLRQAFSFLPPRERATLAGRLVATNDFDAEATDLLHAPFAATTVQQGARLQAAVFTVLETYHLLGENP